MLITIENVLSKAEVQQCRAALAQTDWEEGARTAGNSARQVKHNLQLNDGSEAAHVLGQPILRALAGQALFVSAALPRKIYPPKFNCYQDGGSYGAHVDSAVMQLPGSQEYLRSDLSATLFLAEPDEYDGGELEIEGVYGVQAVKLAAGDLVLYPSTSLHQVTPVTRGARIASFFWIESMVADENARTMLFDLDQSIQELTMRLGAGDRQVLKLTGIYHNLLRRWAKT